MGGSNHKTKTKTSLPLTPKLPNKSCTVHTNTLKEVVARNSLKETTQLTSCVFFVSTSTGTTTTGTTGTTTTGTTTTGTTPRRLSTIEQLE